MGIVPVDLRFIVSGISIEVLAANSHGARGERPARPTPNKMMKLKGKIDPIAYKYERGKCYRCDDIYSDIYKWQEIAPRDFPWEKRRLFSPITRKDLVGFGMVIHHVAPHETGKTHL